MKYICFASIALSSCQPAYAATYGPPAPTVEVPRSAVDRQDFEILPDETLDEAEERIQRDTRSAWRAFWIGQGLAATDVGLTCIMLSQRRVDGSRKFREAGPIYSTVFGKDANCGEIVALRGGMSALQYLLARREVAKDPRAAKKAFRIGWVFSAAVLGWNVAQVTK